MKLNSQSVYFIFITDSELFEAIFDLMVKMISEIF